MTLSERIIELRKEHNLTQQQLAEILNISRGALSLYELGTRKPDHEILNKIADYFNVSVDYLLGRTDERRPADLVKESTANYDIKPMSDPLLDDLLKRVPDLTEEEKESLAEHLEFALKQIEKERQRRLKNEQ